MWQTQQQHKKPKKYCFFHSPPFEVALRLIELKIHDFFSSNQTQVNTICKRIVIAVMKCVGRDLPPTYDRSLVESFLLELIVSTGKSAGISNVELVRRLKRPQPFASYIERGERRIDVIEFCVIMTALGIDAKSQFEKLYSKLPRNTSK